MESLGVVNKAGEDDHAEHQEEHEEGELLGAGPEGVDEDLEARGVSGELEQSENPDDGEELEDVGVLDILEVVLEEHVAVEAEGGHKVNPVEGRLEEDLDRGGDDEPDDQLEGEPDVTDKLDEEEGFMRVGLCLVEGPEGDVVAEVSDGDVPDDGHPAVGVGLEAEGQDGDEDEEDRGEADHPGPVRGVRLVKQRPDLGLRVLPRAHLPAVVASLKAKLLGDFLVGRFVRLDVKLVEDGEGGLGVAVGRVRHPATWLHLGVLGVCYGGVTGMVWCYGVLGCWGCYGEIYLVAVKSPELQFLLEQRPANIRGVVQLARSAHNREK